MPAHAQLKQELRHFHVFFIVLSAVIGGGIFNNNAEALELSGPSGMLLAVGAMGFIAIMFSEALSELVQRFPVPNAIVEYVQTFVDKDLGWVVGIAYWYAFSSIFAIQNLAAANLSRYWGLTQTWQTLVFYVLAPISVIGINMLGVKAFGWVETVGGFLKLCLLFGVSVMFYVFSAQQDLAGADGPINDGFENDPAYISEHVSAVWYVASYAIPIVTYSMLGIEAFAVTAFETKNRRDLSVPPRLIAYVVVIFYLMCAIGQALTVKWTNVHLPGIYGGTAGNGTSDTPSQAPDSSNIAIIAAWNADQQTLAGFLNGCFIFSVLSASNTTLYVASRTLYGLALSLPDNKLGKKLKWLSTVKEDILFQKKIAVPIPALMVSAIAFFWAPFLQLKGGYDITSVIEIIAVSASISCLVVWASLCGAFIRYYKWHEKHWKVLNEYYPEYYRGSRQYAETTWTLVTSWAHSLPAWLGLFGCILVFGFASATWWYTPPTFAKVAIAYGALLVLFLLWVSFKLYNGGRWVVKLDDDADVLITELHRLTALKVDEQPLESVRQGQELANQPRFGPSKPPTEQDDQAASDLADRSSDAARN